MSKYVVMQCKQGSQAWHNARRGTPTASKFAVIVTQQGKPAKSEKRETYLAQLLYERLTGKLVENFVSAAMERGTNMEPQGRAWYALETGSKVQACGFAYPAALKGMCGCSPDGLVGEDGGIEIKCPLPINLLGMLLDDLPPAEYVMQVQGCMFCTGRSWWDLVLYCGDVAGIPSRIYRLEADPVIQAAIGEIIPAFCADLAAREARLRELGGGVRLESVESAESAGDGTLNDPALPAWMRGESDRKAT